MSFDTGEISSAGKTPFVSVIIPSMNGAMTIGSCIDSVRNCHYPNFEVIVVDGKSTDKTPDIASSHGAQIVRGDGEGRGHDINLGIGASKGEIIALTDDDCVVAVDWLRELAESFASPNIGFAGGPNLTCLEKGNQVERVAGHVHDFIRATASRHAQDSIIGCNSAYRRDVLKRAGGFADYPLIAEDTDLHTRILEMGYQAHFSENCVVYRRKHTSLTKLLRQFWRYGKEMGSMYRRNKKTMKNRIRQVYLGWTGFIGFMAILILAIFDHSFAWVAFGFFLAYILFVLIVHARLEKRSGYKSNPFLFIVVSTICMLDYLGYFALEQIVTTNPDYYRKKYASERLET